MKNNINNTGQNQKIPQLRFPEFEEEWSSDKLGSIASFSKGKGISKADISEDGATECIRYGELYTEYSEVITEIVSKTNIDEAELVLSESNDVIIPASGETQIDIATASCVAKSGVALGGDLNIIKSTIDGIFLSYYLNNARKKNIARLAQGISVVHLYASQLASLTVNIPTPPEQTKIANFLTAVDKRINLLQKKKAQLEQYKKGVMQKLFSQELRFKQDDGSDFPDWVEKKLGEVCENIGGSSLEKYQTKNGKYNFISIGNYSKNGNYIDNGQRINLNDKTKTGDIIGAIIFIDENDKYIYNQRSERLICKEIMYPLFAWFFLNSTMVRKKIFSISQGGTQIYVNYPSVKELRFNFPKKEEQQKIANFLSSIDKSIEKLGSQIEHSQEWKQGLLQKMFV